MTDIVDSIDQAIGCQQCGKPLDASPSVDFCSEQCQQRWHEKRSVALTDSASTLRNVARHGWAGLLPARRRDAIAEMSREEGRASCCQAGLEAHPQPCPWHPAQVGGDPVNGGVEAQR